MKDCLRQLQFGLREQFIENLTTNACKWLDEIQFDFVRLQITGK